ncbi:MAG: S8 family peptidase [Actinomyces dentalis]
MGTKPHRRPVLIVTVSIVVVALAAVGIAALTGVFRHDDDVLTTDQGAATAAANTSSNRFVVTYSDGSQAASVIESAQAYGTNIIDSLPEKDRQALTAAAGKFSVTVESVTAHSLGMAGISLSESLTADQVKEFITTLGAADGIEAVETDLHMTALGDTVPETPNDKYFSRQWGLTSDSHGINATGAWSRSTGKDVTVAVIDSGILPAHPDLENNLLPGYDFISDPWISRDDDGRDADPSDNGDSADADICYQGSEARPSSWHGSHVAGIIAASTNNERGVAGVAPNARILPVRALGRCGGTSTDIIDALTWASGGHVNGVPDNDNPAQVINMSLGGTGTCPAFYQKAIDAAVERGSLIVTAAGNEDVDAGGVAPAGCQNVITVGATSSTGARSFYSNYGSVVDVSAPGGDPNTDDGIASTVDRSETTPQEPAYGYMMGTSQAAPHVAGTIALLRAIKPTLTTEEATALLQNTSTPLSNCDRDSCGTGIINATAAVDELAKQGADPGPDPNPSPGTDDKRTKRHGPGVCRSGDPDCRH